MPRKNKLNRKTKKQGRESRRKHIKYFDNVLSGMPEELSNSDLETSISDSGCILGIDFGERRLGLALSDPTGLIAQGQETLETNNPSESLTYIIKLIEKTPVVEVILGLPINMDGTKGEMAKKVFNFAEQLQDRVSCKVRTWDERLTTIAARRAMADMGLETRGRKGHLDRIAATLLLQNYLDYQRHIRNNQESAQ
tara:strand:+ start:7537 stop:8124 length:588 start_codon:yes stop_codon:yes gene_type:complete